jgi:hypothetical protein
MKDTTKRQTPDTPPMTEGQPKKSFPKLRVFLKWFFFVFRIFFASLFAAFLIIGLYFGMPWKILLIFTLTITTLTVFSKPIRKAIYLTTSLLLLAALAWVFLPEDNTDYVSYTFEDELAALQTKPATHDQPNAAELYNHVFESYDKDSFDLIFKYYDEPLKTFSEPWQDSDFPPLAEWFDQNRPSLDSLIQASAMEHCSFPLPATPSQLNIQLERLSLFKRWATVLVRAANNDLANNRLDDALQKHLCIFKMSEHLYRQKTLFDMATGLNLELMATDAVNSFVLNHPVTDRHIDLIEKEKPEFKSDINTDWPHIFECQRLLIKNTVGLFYQKNPQGHVRLTRNLVGAAGTYFGVAKRYRYPTHHIEKTMVLAQWLVVPSNPEKAGRIVDAAFEKHDRLLKQKYQNNDEDKSVKKPRLKLNFRRVVDIAAHISASWFHPMQSQSLQRKRSRNAGKIIIALKNHKNQNGSFPESLDQVKGTLKPDIFIDPVNGDSFVYKLTTDSFMLYSKGENNIDDDGIKYSMENKDDHLIWPITLKQTLENIEYDQQQNNNSTTE